MTAYFHSVPGRLRIRTPLLKTNPGLANGIKTAVTTLPGIDDISVNPTTGSVVTYYDPERIGPDEIMAFFSANKWIDGRNLVPHDRYVNENLSKVGARLGRVLFSWAVGKTLEANGLSLIAALI